MSIKNVTHSPRTSIIGSIFILIGLLLIISPYFVDLKQKDNYWVSGVLTAAGVYLLVAPDKLFGIADKVIKKKLD